MSRIYVNDYASTLNGAITNVATSAIVTSATGLPTLAGSQYYYLTLTDYVNYEIIKVTARTTTTLSTIQRGMEGTTAQAWPGGTYIAMMFTADSLNGILPTPGASGSVFISDGTSWIASTVLMPNTVGAAGKILRSNGTSNAYTTSTFADTYAINTLLYASSANTVAALSTANSGFLATSSSGVPAIVVPSSVTVAAGDQVLIQDVSNSNQFAYVLASSIAGLLTPGTGLDSTAGTKNVIGGSGAGTSQTAGSQCTMIGYQAGNLGTSFSDCTFVGYQAGGAAIVTTGANGSTGIGSNALHNLTSGTANTALGYFAGAGISSGANNTYIGYSAGISITGVGNVAVGDNTMGNGTAGRINCVILGSGAGNFGTGSATVVVGGGGGAAIAGRAHGANSVYVGASAGGNCSGTDNVCVGYNSGSDGGGGTGTLNTMIGSTSGLAGATGAVYVGTGSSKNTFLGYRASGSNVACVGCIALGADAVGTLATGATSGTFGPGISIGSAANLVGFRGDGSIIPSNIQDTAGFWKMKVNGTQYYLPLYTDAYLGTSTPTVTAGAVTLAYSGGSVQTVVTAANTTITLPTPVAGKILTVIVQYGGVHTITWAGGGTLKWSGGVAPVATSVNGKYDIYILRAFDTTNMFGSDGGRNY